MFLLCDFKNLFTIERALHKKMDRSFNVYTDFFRLYDGEKTYRIFYIGLDEGENSYYFFYPRESINPFRLKSCQFTHWVNDYYNQGKIAFKGAQLTWIRGDHRIIASTIVNNADIGPLLDEWIGNSKQL